MLAIVGANNVGKSHFLRALNAFFNYDDEKEAFLSQDHVYNVSIGGVEPEAPVVAAKA